MKLTKKQKETALPYVQAIVEAQIRMWEAERDLESILGADFDGMDEAANHLSLSYHHGDEVILDDVQSYFDACKEE